MPIIINCVQRTTCSYAKTGLKSKGKFWIHFLWKVWLMYGLVSMERIGHNLRHIKVAIKKKRSWYSKQILVYISICSHITKIFLLRGTVKESEFLSQNFPLQKGTTFVFQNLEWLALFFFFFSIHLSKGSYCARELISSLWSFLLWYAVCPGNQYTG